MPPKGSRKPKDPNKPKGRMSGYAFFVQAKSEEAKAEGNTLPLREFSKKCSEEWKSLDDATRQKYEALAAEDKIRYEREMVGYVPPPPSDNDYDEPQKKKKRKKDPDAPKRGMSAFLFFCNSRRPELKLKFPDFAMGEMSRKLGDEWKTMDDTAKAPFEKQSIADRQRYEKQMAEYKADSEQCH
ncbi:high mobility group protein B2-like [Sycon ciliatum]|uniref:high mobility group protein B2-like n=1 Tax=Sycon ciliatum TaxID=27933 RepID=UPI0020AB47B3|eukprot:scpid80714/ scgid34502/ High mobility group-T protein; HMG-T1